MDFQLMLWRAINDEIASVLAEGRLEEIITAHPGIFGNVLPLAMTPKQILEAAAKVYCLKIEVEVATPKMTPEIFGMERKPKKKGRKVEYEDIPADIKGLDVQPPLTPGEATCRFTTIGEADAVKFTYKEGPSVTKTSE